MKHWLLNRFLPMWAKETVLQDNRQLERENRELLQRINELEAYIAGLQRGLRAVRRMPVVRREADV